MNCLELFSGTHSVGKVLERLGHKVVSLDLKGATINVDILKWDYKVYPPNHFDYIHASPPCDTFSICRRSWIGRQLKAHGNTIITKEILDNDERTIGLVILNKTLEIIDYFKPKFYTIENPKSGNMKKYITTIPYSDVEYCAYGFPNKKPTRIWNNFGFEGKTCDGTHEHIVWDLLPTTKAYRYKIPERLIEDWLLVIKGSMRD
jgi:site-specific DNA-cytosine methylase